MAGTLHYRLRIRTAADDADDLVISSIPSATYPYIAADGLPTGDGQTIDPLTGKTTIGAYTVQVIDAVGVIPAPTLSSSANDGWEYANQAAAEAAGWTFANGLGAEGTITVGATDQVYAGNKSLKMATTGTGALAGSAAMIVQKVFTAADGIVAGARYRCSIRGRMDTRPWYDVMSKFSANGVELADITSTNTWQLLTGIGIADGSAQLTITLFRSQPFVTGNFNVWWDALTIEAIDAAATSTGRIVTGHLTDTEGQQHLLSRKAFVEESTDGGATWPVLTAGYVNRYALVDALRWEFTIGDSRRVEQSKRLFERTSDPVKFPTLIGVMDRASCIIGGPIIGDWAILNDRERPLYRVASVSGTTVKLQWVSGYLYYGGFSVSTATGSRTIEDDALTFFNANARDYLPSGTGFEAGVLDFSTTPLPGLIARFYDVSTGAWVSDQAALAYSENVVLGRFYQFIGSDGSFYVDWTGALPSVGATYRLAVFPQEISDRNPLHLSGHPMDLLAAWLTLADVQYDGTSLAAVKAALGAALSVDYRITKWMICQDACEQLIYAPFGVAPRLNDAGAFEFFLTRDPSAASVSTLSNDDLTSDAGTAFSNEEAKAVNLLTFRSQGFAFVSKDSKSKIIPSSTTAYDFIYATTVTISVDAKDAAGTAVFGERQVVWEIPGQIAGLHLRGPLGLPGSLELWLASQARPLFDWQGRGSVEGEFHVLRGRTAAKVGQIVTHQFAHVPTASSAQVPSSQRGTVPRRAIVLRRSVVPDGVTLLLQDRGPTGAPIPPVFILPEPCAAIAAPTALTETVAATAATLTWTNTRTDLPLDIAYRLVADTDPILVASLPAGSTTAVLTLPDPTTAYTVGVRYREPAPRNCVSDWTETGVTTGALAVLLAPTDPAAFADGAGTFGLEVTATEPSADVEVWIAVETARGSATAGAYTLAGSVPSVAGGRTRFTNPGLAPNDGLLRFLEARHTESGFTPSAFTTPVSINPWLAIPPVDPTPTPDPTVGLQVLPIPIVLVTGAVPLGLRELPATATPVTTSRGTESKFPLDSATSARVEATIDYTTAPVGAYLAIQGEAPGAPGTWDYLDGVDGPKVAIDAASLAAVDLAIGITSFVVTGGWALIRAELKDDVRLRAVIVGGSGSEDVSIPHLEIQLTAAAVDGPASETPPPSDPTPDPGSCTVPTPLSLTSGWTPTAPSGSSFAVVGSTVVLTLDGTGTGAAYEEKTLTGLTPSQQYTFYLGINPDAVAVNAFLEVMGGETATAVLTGAHRVMARGTTDGAGAITLRFGAQTIQGAPASAGSDAVQNYANQAAMVAGGWTLTNALSPSTGGAFVFHDSEDVGPLTDSLKFVSPNNGYYVQTGYLRAERTFTVVNGHSYTVKIWAGAHAGNGWYNTATMTVISGAHSQSDNVSGAGADKHLSATVVADGTSLTVRLNVNASNVGAPLEYWRYGGLTIDGLTGGGATVVFSDLGSCLGSGLGDGVTGLGGTPTTPPNDPIPTPPAGGYPPPPVGGARPFMAYALPAAGLGYWNSTNLGLTRTSAKNLLDAAATAGAKDFVDPGGFGGRWLDAALRFSYDLWKHEIDLIYNDPIAGPALLARIADGTAKAHMLIDEPMLLGRWGLIIPFATVQRMAQYSKSLWPTWKTVIRVQPTHPWFTGHMLGLDWTYGQYALSKGGPSAYLTNNLAAAAAKGHGLVIGMNIAHFNTEGNSGRMITPAELRHYGGILASSSATIAFGMWRYYDYVYAQAGFPDAVKYVRDLYASFD